MARRFLTILAVLLSFPAIAARVENDAGYKEAGGLAVYLGVLPAAMVRGHETHPEERMHGGVPTARHAYHVVAALFDAATGARVEDATVTARVKPRRLSPESRPLERMEIAGTVSYGGYFTMGGDDPYEIEISVVRADDSKPVTVAFAYEHGQR
jgi:hypothetical protein